MKIPTKPPPSRRSWMPLGSRGRFYGPLPMPIGCLDWPPRKPLDSGFHVDFMGEPWGNHGISNCGCIIISKCRLAGKTIGKSSRTDG